MIYKNPNKAVEDAAAIKRVTDWKQRAIELQCDCPVSLPVSCKMLQQPFMVPTKSFDACPCDCHAPRV